MSPWRSCTLRKPRSSMRARARLSIAGLRSAPTALPANGPSSSAIRPVPAPTAGNARLRLAENADEFADRQLRLGEQAEQAKPRDLAGGFEGVEEGIEGKRRVGSRHKDMFMSFFSLWQARIPRQSIRRSPGAAR